MEEQVIELLENINERFDTLETRLETVETTGTSTEQQVFDYIKSTEQPESWYEAAQNTVIIVVLIVLVISPILRSRFEKKLHNSLNGYGTDKNGKPVTLADVQREQLRIEKENRSLLYALSRKMGIKKNDL